MRGLGAILDHILIFLPVYSNKPLQVKNSKPERATSVYSFHGVFSEMNTFITALARIKNIRLTDHTVSKTYRSVNGIFDFLMTFSFLI